MTHCFSNTKMSKNIYKVRTLFPKLNPCIGRPKDHRFLKIKFGGPLVLRFLDLRLGIILLFIKFLVQHSIRSIVYLNRIFSITSCCS